MNFINKFEIGIVGLGTMGRNLLLNIADHHHTVIGFDKDKSKVQLTDNCSKSSEKAATDELTIFLAALQSPRAILLLVPAGAAVDAVIGEISPLLNSGDLIIDAGNSHFKDTDRREINLREKGIFFSGMGVSGGESGARNGPSIMPGGDKTAYERVRPILESIAAKSHGEVCVAHLGNGSAGHFVKMVHNGIEYALMQLIAETYHIMKMGLHLSNDECHHVYNSWNKSELNSYLLEITAEIFLKKDDRSNARLIDMILDVAKQNGTGKWTSQDAMDLQIPVPCIDAAVAARDLSSVVARLKSDRKIASKTLLGPQTKLEKKITADSEWFLKTLRGAYYASSIIIFAQSMTLLQKASSTYNYKLNLETIARIWRGGCIIRAGLLDQIMDAYHSSPELSNLLIDPTLGKEVSRTQSDLRSVVEISSSCGFPIPTMMASLSYYDSYRSPWLPTNLIQAQRDYFGAHTYERIDESGSFHTEWENHDKD